MLTLDIEGDEVVVNFDGAHFRKYLSAMRALAFPRFRGKEGGWRFPLRLFPRMAAILPGLPETPEMSSRLFDRLSAEAKAREACTALQAVRDIQFAPPGFSGRLYAFQRIGAAFLARGRRVVLCDDVGLGKTVQAIAAVEELFAAGEIDSVLIIAPGHLKRQWAREFERFTGGGVIPTVIEGSPAARAKQWAAVENVAIMNYELLPRDEVSLSRPWDLVILDEAQEIKNSRTVAAKLCRRLDAPLRWCLTATAIENSLPELHSIMEFISPGLFGTWDEFDRRYILRDFWGGIAGYRNLDDVREIIRPHVLRRRVEDCIENFPVKDSELVPVKFSDAQRLVYEDARHGLLECGNEYRAMAVNTAMSLQQTMYLREACDHVRLLADDLVGGSPKLEPLRVLLEAVRAKGERALVFTEWERMARILQDEIGCPILTGKMGFGQRDEILRRWREGDGHLVTTDCSKQGLNLQDANWIINFEPHWNPAVMRQRVGRVWRLTQGRPVHALAFVVQDSIEERMIDVLNGKVALFGEILDSLATKAKQERIE